MVGSGVFWVKIGRFSTFWPFSVKPVNSGRVLKPETMVVDAGDSIGTCSSKTTRVSMLFSCSARYGVGDELAVGTSAGGCKMASLNAVRLA